MTEYISAITCYRNENRLFCIRKNELKFILLKLDHIVFFLIIPSNFLVIFCFWNVINSKAKYNISRVVVALRYTNIHIFNLIIHTFLIPHFIEIICTLLLGSLWPQATSFCDSEYGPEPVTDGVCILRPRNIAQNDLFRWLWHTAQTPNSQTPSRLNRASFWHCYAHCALHIHRTCVRNATPPPRKACTTRLLNVLV